MSGKKSAAVAFALFVTGTTSALSQNPVVLQREYRSTGGQVLLTAPAKLNLADVHARVIALLRDTGSEVLESRETEIVARTTFATFADPVLVAIPVVVVDLNYQRAAHEANGEPIYQVRRITLTQAKDAPVRVQFCSRVKQYSPKTNGPPDFRIATQCKLEFREWNALREVTARLFD